MNIRVHGVRIAAPGLRLLAVLALVITTVTSAAAAPTAQEAAVGGVWSLGINAAYSPSQQDAEIGNYTDPTFGARFTVTSENGEYIGECTLEVVEDPRGWHNCRVDVPSDRISVVWQDPDSIPAGYAPIRNPIAFDPTTYITGPHNVGAWFRNYPVTAGAQDAGTESMSIIPVGPDGSVLGVGFSVTTLDGAPLGSCVVPLDFPSGYIPNCSVEVPRNSTVAVWFDASSSSTSLVPVENPVYFNTSTEQNAQMWGPAFEFAAAGSGSSLISNGGSSSQSSTGPVTDVASLLPVIGDVPGGLVETGRQTRTLPDVTAYYTNPAETTQLFEQWGWQQNAIASFALPSNQQAQSGQINGVYVSIHRFGSPAASREALDFSVTEQAAGTSLREIDTRHFGDYTTALFGPLDYGNETTLLTQQGDLLIRVSAAMLDGDPTPAAESIMERIIQRATPTTETGWNVGGDSIIGPDSSEPEVFFPIGCGPAEACLSATVTVSTQDGQVISTCTMPDTPLVAPWVCVAQNVPRGIVVAVTIDGIAPGYVAEEHPVYWDTSIEPEMYGNSGIPSFSLVPAGRSS